MNEATFMRTTVTLDDELLAQAMKLTGIDDRGTLLHAGLRVLIQQESARRLARLGGSQPALPVIRRRRSER
jgi:Arc/MetJ family transcription regulator